VNDRERFEALVELIDELVEAARSKPVIVEGIKDERSLRELGVEGNIIKLNRGMRLFNLCEDIAREHSSVIILTDWDRKGGHLARLLREGFDANEVAYDLDLRARLAILVKKDVKDVEGLLQEYRRLRELTLRHENGSDRYARRTVSRNDGGD